MASFAEGTLTNEDGQFFVRNEEFSVVGVGETKEDAMLDYLEYFEWLIPYYCNKPDFVYNLQGLKIKRKLENLKNR